MERNKGGFLLKLHWKIGRKKSGRLRRPDGAKQEGGIIPFIIRNPYDRPLAASFPCKFARIRLIIHQIWDHHQKPQRGAFLKDPLEEAERLTLW